MKKISRALCLVLALVMVFALAACGSEAPKDVDISALAEGPAGSRGVRRTLKPA